MWWECLNTKRVSGPGKKWGHTCNSVNGGKLLYVFGGYGSDQEHVNDVHVFDTVKKTWSKPMPKGAPPSPRDSHSCTTVGSRLFVFGGTDETKPLNDLRVLDTLSNTWIVPAVTGEGPSAREGHGATLVDKRLFVFGGCGRSIDNQDEVYLNDLYILDTESFIWENAKTSGTVPPPRDNHTCSTWNNKVVVVAGEDSSDCYLSDVYMLDADTLVWEQINTSGHRFAPRAGHTTVSIGNQLFVFGGFTDSRNLYDDLNVLNLESRTWSKVTAVNSGPSARFAVAGDCFDERRGIIAYIGGCNGELHALDDIYYLHTNMHEGNGISESHLVKSSLRSTMNKSRGNNLQCLTDDVHLRACSHAGDSRSSQAAAIVGSVTSVIPCGYTFQTVMNGQLFHGVLFNCMDTSVQDGQSTSNRRRRRNRRGNERTTFNECQATNASPMGTPTMNLTSSNMAAENIGHNESLNMTTNNLEPSAMFSKILETNNVSNEAQITYAEHPNFQFKSCQDEEKMDDGQA